MTRIYRFVSLREDEEGAERQTQSLAGLALVLLLVVLALFLVRALACKAAVDECLMSGRLNCDAVLRAHPVPTLW